MFGGFLLQQCLEHRAESVQRHAEGAFDRAMTAWQCGLHCPPRIFRMMNDRLTILLKSQPATNGIFQSLR
jgi:hypothetical protein